MAISVESDLDDHKYGISICFEGQDEELRLRSLRLEVLLVSVCLMALGLILLTEGTISVSNKVNLKGRI